MTPTVDLNALADAYHDAPNGSDAEDAALAAFLDAYFAAPRMERATLRMTRTEFCKALDTVLLEDLQ